MGLSAAVFRADSLNGSCKFYKSFCPAQHLLLCKEQKCAPPILEVGKYQCLTDNGAFIQIVVQQEGKQHLSISLP